jgi:ketosteroid isomerase-like protein
MKKIAVFFCTCIILIGCTSTPKVDILAETEAIRSLEDQWSAAIASRDLEKSMSSLVADAVMMDSNVPTYNGLEAIRKATEDWYADTIFLFNTYTYGIDIIEVSASGDLAYVRGHSQMSYKTPDGLKEVKSKWVDIWKKSEAGWKCILNIGNTDNPKTDQ